MEDDEDDEDDEDNENDEDDEDEVMEDEKINIQELYRNFNTFMQTCVICCEDDEDEALCEKLKFKIYKTLNKMRRNDLYK